MILIGLSGAIDHGKTTFAKFLDAQSTASQHYESSDIIIEVANALRQNPSPNAENIDGIIGWLQALPAAVNAATHTEISIESLNITAARLQQEPQEFATLIGYLRMMELSPESLSTHINSSNKDDFRTLLQFIGGYLAKTVSGRLWYTEIVKRAVAGEHDLVTAGGVRFPEDAACLRDAGGFILSIVRPSTSALEQQDVTERERSFITPDATIVNDSTLVALEAVSGYVYADLRANTLRPTYLASDSSVN